MYVNESKTSISNDNDLNKHVKLMRSLMEWWLRNQKWKFMIKLDLVDFRFFSSNATEKWLCPHYVDDVRLTERCSVALKDADRLLWRYTHNKPRVCSCHVSQQHLTWSINVCMRERGRMEGGSERDREREGENGGGCERKRENRNRFVNTFRIPHLTT